MARANNYRTIVSITNQLRFPELTIYPRHDFTWITEGKLEMHTTFRNRLYFDVRLDNAFKVNQKVKCKSDSEIAG